MRTCKGVVIDDVSDAELWAAVQAGDGAAIAGLYDRYAGRLHAYCFRRTGSFALAQDLTSVVWLEAWRTRSRARLQLDRSLGPWLFGIANNVVRNSDRARRRHWAALARLPAPLPEPDHAQEVSDQLDDERRMRHVLQAVAQLPRHEQDVLALVAWADLTHAQVAAALGISVGTVKSRLSRARARLQQTEAARLALNLPTANPRTTA